MENQLDLEMFGAPEVPVVKAGGYKFVAVLLFLLAAGGLFLGMLCQVVAEFISPVTPFVGEWYDGSFFGYIWQQVEVMLVNGGLVSLFSSPITTTSAVTNATLSLVELLFAFLFAITVIVSLVCMIVALVPQHQKEGAEGKTSRAAKCVYAVARLIMLSYGGMFFYTLLLSTANVPELSLAVIDVNALVIMGLTFITLSICALAKNKGIALVNIFLTVLSIAAVFGLAWPTSTTSGLIADAIALLFTAGSDIFFSIMTVVLIFIMMINVYISFGRLASNKKYVFDIVRFALQLVVIALFITSYAIHPVYSIAPTAIITENLVSFIIYVATTVVALVVAIVVVAVRAVKARKARSAEDTWMDTEEVEPVEETPFEETEPVAEAEPVAEPTPAPAPAAPAQMPTIVFVNPTPATPVNVPSYVPVPTPTPVPAPAPVVVPASAPATERHMSEFELRMQALAKGEMPAPAPAPAPAPTYSAPAPKAEPRPEYSAVYTYDAFLNLLTIAEKNEFGDMFIANKYGVVSNLPTYVISGDNSEFFSKVFIYLGRFRKYLSESLLEKLYDYVSKN